MTATKVGKFGDIVRVIGGIFVPSFLGMALAALTFVSTIMGTASMPSARSDAEEAGRHRLWDGVHIYRSSRSWLAGWRVAWLAFIE
ncbi:MAG: hypothetical protein IPO41_01440 [Acidobacteria bacterium]|nr:hypothetical protein [Acidobacteriota bacterium]